MPFGKTLELRATLNTLKPAEPRVHPTPGRDRSLSGKERRKVRKAEQRRQRRHG